MKCYQWSTCHCVPEDWLTAVRGKASRGVDRILEWCVLDFQPPRGGVEEWEGLE